MDVLPDEVFASLSNPVRRRILELLVAEERNAGALARSFALSRPAVSEHLQVLRRAGLVRERQVGRERVYAIEPAPLMAVQDWLKPFEAYWRGRLQALSKLVEDECA